MNISPKTSLKKILLIMMETVFGFLIFSNTEPEILIELFILQYIVIVYVSKFDFESPLCWYLGVFTLYTIGYPLLYVTGNNMTQGFSPEPIQWCWIAVFVFVCVFSPEQNKKLNEKMDCDYNFGNMNIMKYFIIVSLIIVFVDVYLIYSSGYRNKGEIYGKADFYITFVFTLIYSIQTIYIYLMHINLILNKKSENMNLMIIIGAESLLLTLFSGERDIFIRYLILTVFFLFINKEINRFKMFLSCMMIVVFFMISRFIKYYFLTAESNLYSFVPSLFSWKGLIGIIFGGEFESASKNLQILANDSVAASGVFFGSSYISDVVRILGITLNSSMTWFNDRYYFGSAVGHGFTIVGEGFVNFGILGIVLSFVIIGSIINWMYKKRGKNPAYASIYIISIPIFMYAIRADLANIFSPMVRQILLPLLLANLFLRKENRSHT